MFTFPDTSSEAIVHLQLELPNSGPRDLLNRVLLLTWGVVFKTALTETHVMSETKTFSYWDEVGLTRIDNKKQS